ncbi:MAG: 4Fe-4S dicluster domain-containing protein [Armatimonadota bacterium]|nr:4Fe-4S dicluster domain-containing protein [Armatimonadota bacterium]MCX7776696.1 4Fe-4S dicluster domain-containing protein [Armatimonadota bacterium]MDW8026334.1 4Fe-4S dicluster domain-containing protein [Armatimonadota bacterium]
MSDVVKLTDMRLKEFTAEVERRSGQRISQCYQCGKCSSGCPMAFAMDIDPARIMRLIQLGLRDDVLKSNTIWICAACQTCTTRCPQEVEIAHVMDTLRIMALEAGYTDSERETVEALSQFVENIERRGRVFEPELALRLNIALGRPFKDFGRGLQLFARGKLPMLPEKIKGLKELRSIWEKVKKLERVEGERHVNAHETQHS